MRFVPLEGAEVVPESGESDGVERHPRHVVGDVHGLTVASAAVPGLDQAVRHAQHHGVVCAHGAQRERGHQDVVRLGPVGLVVVRGEQSVGGELTDVLECGPDRLREPTLVGQIGDQVEVAHEERVPAVQPSYERGSVLAHQSHHLLERGAAGGGDVDQGEAVGGRALAGQAVGGACCLGTAYDLGGICGLGVRRGGGHGATTAFRGTGVLRSSLIAWRRPPAPWHYMIVQSNVCDSTCGGREKRNAQVLGPDSAPGRRRPAPTLVGLRRRPCGSTMESAVPRPAQDHLDCDHDDPRQPRDGHR